MKLASFHLGTGKSYCNDVQRLMRFLCAVNGTRWQTEVHSERLIGKLREAI